MKKLVVTIILAGIWWYIVGYTLSDLTNILFNFIGPIEGVKPEDQKTHAEVIHGIYLIITGINTIGTIAVYWMIFGNKGSWLHLITATVTLIVNTLITSILLFLFVVTFKYSEINVILGMGNFIMFIAIVSLCVFQVVKFLDLSDLPEQRISTFGLTESLYNYIKNIEKYKDDIKNKKSLINNYIVKSKL